MEERYQVQVKTIVDREALLREVVKALTPFVGLAPRAMELAPAGEKRTVWTRECVTAARALEKIRAVLPQEDP